MWLGPRFLTEAISSAKVEPQQFIVVSRMWDETPMVLGWGSLGDTMARWLLARLQRRQARGKLSPQMAEQVAKRARRGRRSVVPIFIQQASIRFGSNSSTSRHEVVCLPMAVERTTSECLFTALERAIPQLSLAELTKMVPYCSYLVIILSKDSASANAKLASNYCASLPKTVLLLNAGHWAHRCVALQMRRAPRQAQSCYIVRRICVPWRDSRAKL